MNNVKKIIAFCRGDSTQCSTWSNVPYFFLKNLESLGIEVVRVNTQIEDDCLFAKKLVKIVNAAVRHTYQLFQKDSTAMNTVDRFRIYEQIENRRICAAVEKHKDADFALFFDYSHSLEKKYAMKVILFCDWTIEYEIKKHQKRKPNYFEEKMIKRQYCQMSAADCIITLFPNVYDELVKQFGQDKVHYLGNVINAELDDSIDVHRLINTHYHSKRILMIGRKAYKKGLIQLAEAVRIYNEGTLEADQLYIDVIGMTEKETGVVDQHIIYYGYLNKNLWEQNETYYNLIRNAKLICNTTENWIGASSIIEAMYWRLPVIVNPTEDIYKTFSKEISFGKYVLQNDPYSILEAIKWIFCLDQDQYSEVCKASYEAVKDFTWEGYAKRTVDLMKRI